MGTDTTQQTLAAFIRNEKLWMDDPEWADRNPNIDWDDWAARHFKLVIRKGRRSMSVHFSQGAAHEKEPTLEDVLDVLASDASTVENTTTFGEWASDLGYDADSRKAERIYNTIVKQSKKLKTLLGSESYYILLWQTERL